LTLEQATDAVDEVINWEAELGEHSASLLRSVELALAAAIGAHRMKS
jgi:hypothetical protein